MAIRLTNEGPAMEDASMWLTTGNLVRLARAREMLAEVHECELLSVERIAREVGISPFHFIRRFEAAFGM